MEPAAAAGAHTFAAAAAPLLWLWLPCLLRFLALWQRRSAVAEMYHTQQGVEACRFLLQTNGFGGNATSRLEARRTKQAAERRKRQALNQERGAGVCLCHCVDG